jgi:hypothetical protein
VFLVPGSVYLIGREGIKKYIAAASLVLLLSLAAMKAVRLVGLYGFFWMPLSMLVCGGPLADMDARVRRNLEVVLLVTGLIVSGSVNYNWHNRPFLGIDPASNAPAEFFKKEKIAGPIFNNYDDAGYLIFSLGPAQKLFVDDRMEAFPRDFFSRTYIPMQTDSALWEQMERRYHFNAIFFSIDATPWGMKFIRDRFADPSWATVYYTDKAIIFLKRNAQNAAIIRRHEIKVVYVQL